VEDHEVITPGTIYKQMSAADNGTHSAAVLPLSAVINQMTEVGKLCEV
jgi:hypothetical protein